MKQILLDILFGIRSTYKETLIYIPLVVVSYILVNIPVVSLFSLLFIMVLFSFYKIGKANRYKSERLTEKLHTRQPKPVGSDQLEESFRKKNCGTGASNVY